MKPITQQAHELLALHMRGSLAIDATAGNGHDTLFLAQLVGPAGTVWAFDIQPEALRKTVLKLEEQGISVELRLKSASPSVPKEGCSCVIAIEADHAAMAAHIPAEVCGHVSAVMFNLGYLPGADKSCITMTASTLAALNAAWELLAPEGVLSVVVYPGHPGGREEAEAVRRWIEERVSRGAASLLSGSAAPTSTGPQLLAIQYHQ